MSTSPSILPQLIQQDEQRRQRSATTATPGSQAAARRGGANRTRRTEPVPSRARPLPTMPRSGPPGSVGALLEQAQRGLVEAEREREPGPRFAAAYLSALRAAAAVLALRGRPHRGRSQPTSAWHLLARLAPEFAEWAAFFADCSHASAAVQAGITRVVTQRGADDLLRQSGEFLELVGRAVHDVGL
ncbi:MAG: SAV_6107 family HEPN domain-containing protein [Sciscionella sp.]